MIADRRHDGATHVDLGILAEDHPVELLQLPARLDPELVVQNAAAVVVGLQGLCLPAAAVERQHQQSANALTHRVLRGERLQLRNELVVRAQLEVGFDPVLQRPDA